MRKENFNANGHDYLIRISNVFKSFKSPSGEFHALKDITLSIRKGQLMAITGKSGSGKTTLLNIISGIDKPTRGSINIGGTRIEQLSEDKLAAWRGKNVGVVFQFFQLIPTLTILENVMLPMDFCNTYSNGERRPKAMQLLELTGIPEQADKFPATLSGGQQQRASIARALANEPQILIADEPTGNLDSQTANSILNLFRELSDSGKTVIVVTHEKEFAKYFKNTISIADGILTGSNGIKTYIKQEMIEQ
jgi:putative ABC transport system ATP-binding protein